MEKYSQSIFDSLMRIMPELNQSARFGDDAVDPLAANSLFQVWRTGSSSNQKVYQKPHTLSHDDMERMKKADLVKVIGDKFEVTEKGANVIKVMILGDDRSIFDETGVNLDYHTALNNTKNIKTAKKQKIATNFWDILEEDKIKKVAEDFINNEELKRPEDRQKEIVILFSNNRLIGLNVTNSDLAQDASEINVVGGKDYSGNGPVEMFEVRKALQKWISDGRPETNASNPVNLTM